MAKMKTKIKTKMKNTTQTFKACAVTNLKNSWAKIMMRRSVRVALTCKVALSSLKLIPRLILSKMRQLLQTMHLL